MLEQETILNHAMTLYRQRDTVLPQYRVDLRRLLNIKTQLRELLFALSRFKPYEDDEPSEAEDTFVYLAKRLIPSDKELRINTAKQACEWLLESGAKGQGARDALLGDDEYYPILANVIAHVPDEDVDLKYGDQPLPGPIRSDQMSV